MGKKATKPNGATRLLPSSHLRDMPVLQGKANVYAETNHTDALMVLSACFHVGSATTITDEERIVYSAFFTRVWMRQENRHDIEESKKQRE